MVIIFQHFLIYIQFFLCIKVKFGFISEHIKVNFLKLISTHVSKVREQIVKKNFFVSQICNDSSKSTHYRRKALCNEVNQ